MSYSAYIHLKPLDSDEFWDMVQKLKELKIKNIRYPLCMGLHELPDPMLEDSSFESMYKNKHKLVGYSRLNILYWRQHNLLGLIGDPKWHGPEISGLFPTMIYFQNSSDQDYEYELYDPIPQFRSLICPIDENDDEETVYEKKTWTYRNIENMLRIPDAFDDDTSQTDTIKLTILPSPNPVTDPVFCKYYNEVYQKIHDTRTNFTK